ncbi:MAG: hypothetical protein ABW186_16530 [Rhodanobacteraceae bacterium]
MHRESGLVVPERSAQSARESHSVGVGWKCGSERANFGSQLLDGEQLGQNGTSIAIDGGPARDDQGREIDRFREKCQLADDFREPVCARKHCAARERVPVLLRRRRQPERDGYALDIRERARAAQSIVACGQRFVATIAHDSAACREVEFAGPRVKRSKRTRVAKASMPVEQNPAGFRYAFHGLGARVFDRVHDHAGASLSA